MKKINQAAWAFLTLLATVGAIQIPASLTASNKVNGDQTANSNVDAPTNTIEEPALKGMGAVAAAAGIRIGIISYWNLESPDWAKVPENSLVVINPDSGILEQKSKAGKLLPEWETNKDAAKWNSRVLELQARHVVVIGYVPTGEFDHNPHCKLKREPGCQKKEWIKLQVETYYTEIPTLDGIFYDETSPKKELEAKADYKTEYALLRSINRSQGITVFNVGTPSEKAVDATNPGEHLVLFESTPAEFKSMAALISESTATARQKGILVWHLIHTVPKADQMCLYVAEMIKRGAQYGYVTNIPQNPYTWNSLPEEKNGANANGYWDKELRAFSTGGQPCPEK
jgi:hypothetical protein